MNAASQLMVDMAELNDAAGRVIAEHTGAEAGMVTSGSAGRPHTASGRRGGR